jgi:very-short-patch-repair endonuclease
VCLHNIRKDETLKRKAIHYNPKLKELARQLRNNSTKSEIYLWKYLNGKQMLGYDFHRQKPIDNYIVDFFCHDLMFCIELDGISHSFEETISRDKEKESKLNELGIAILRFADQDVFTDITNVLRAIDGYILQLQPPSTNTPLPLSRGETQNQKN